LQFFINSIETMAIEKEKTGIKKPFYSFLPTDLEGVNSLTELALDLRWSWNHAADEVWQQA